jgi:hypothetical protein
MSALVKELPYMEPLFIPLVEQYKLLLGNKYLGTSVDCLSGIDSIKYTLDKRRLPKAQSVDSDYNNTEKRLAGCA